MLLKKPYAFIIKHFKLIHIILSILAIFLIYRTNVLLGFFNQYMENQNSVIGQNLRENLYNALMYIFPIVSIIVTIVLLWTMIIKKKPSRFYLFNLVLNIYMIILFIYSYSFIGQLEIKVVDLLNIRVIRDLLLILISGQGLALIILLIRSIGFDIKKFEFLSDLQDLELSQDDMEEIEIEFDFDSNERKRKRKRNIRYLKYSYLENKFFINTVLVFVLIITCIFIVSRLNIYSFTHKEHELLNTDYYSFKIDNSYLINTSYKNNKITDNYLVVIDLSIKKNINQNNLIVGNFKLQIGNNKYSSTNNYDKYITDLGTAYNNQELTNSFNNYLLVYEISKDDINKNMKLLYFENGNSVKVKVNPVTFKKDNKSFNMGEEILIDDTAKVKLNSYEISDRFTINYDYCINDKCYSSIQYLVPTLNTNYDKVIIKINSEFKKGDNSKYNDFSGLVSSIGTIEYKIGDNTYTSNLEKISDLKKNDENIYYYEVNRDIINSDSIKLNFNTRKCKYSYILK